MDQNPTHIELPTKITLTRTKNKVLIEVGHTIIVLDRDNLMEFTDILDMFVMELEEDREDKLTVDITGKEVKSEKES